jgi:hypothetical protein
MSTSLVVGNSTHKGSHKLQEFFEDFNFFLGAHAVEYSHHVH